MATGTPLAPGARLGKYEILKPLTVGGMAELFLARAKGPEGFQKLVVLKRVQPQLAQNPDFVEMFLDEARLAAKLQHPNIAQVHDFGEVDGSYYFTMEYVHGHDLLAITEELKSRGEPALPLAESVSIGLGLSAGLHYAHEKRNHKDLPLGIVHRDVSLGNVLVSKDGHVKLVDFGIAKAISRQHQTQAGTVRGKIWYMSPEQTAGYALDRRSDIYSAGIVLYHLTLGVRPFDGDTLMDIANKIRGAEFVRPTERDPKYPRALEKIIVRALQPSRKKRYQTAQELNVDLEKFAHEQRLVTSSRALAEYLETLMGPQDGTWVGAIPSDDFEEEETKARDTSEPVVQEIFLEAPEPGASSAPPSPGKKRVRPKATNAGVWPLITLACLGLAVGAYYYGKQQSEPGASGFSDTDEVVLRVETEPSDAKVQFGDDNVQVGLLRTKPSKLERTLRVSAPGYATYKTKLALVENMRMVIVLAEDDDGDRAERRRKRAERRRRRQAE